MAKEWYRQRSWSPAAKEEFFRRLRRSRDKGQYLNIQSGELLAAWKETKEAALRDAALELAELSIRDFPNHTLAACALSLKAECLVAGNKLEEASAAFRALIARERQFPNVQTGGPLAFALFVATTSQTDKFGEALDLLAEVREEQAKSGTVFPRLRFQAAAAQAMILAHLGRDEESSSFAREALAAAAQATSGFRNHPTLGLVGDESLPVLEQIKKLAGIEPNAPS